MYKPQQGPVKKKSVKRKDELVYVCMPDSTWFGYTVSVLLSRIQQATTYVQVVQDKEDSTKLFIQLPSTSYIVTKDSVGIMISNLSSHRAYNLALFADKATVKNLVTEELLVTALYKLDPVTKPAQETQEPSSALPAETNTPTALTNEGVSSDIDAFGYKNQKAAFSMYQRGLLDVSKTLLEKMNSYWKSFQDLPLGKEIGDKDNTRDLKQQLISILGLMVQAQQQSLNDLKSKVDDMIGRAQSKTLSYDFFQNNLNDLDDFLEQVLDSQQQALTAIQQIQQSALYSDDNSPDRSAHLNMILQAEHTAIDIGTSIFEFMQDRVDFLRTPAEYLSPSLQENVHSELKERMHGYNEDMLGDKHLSSELKAASHMYTHAKEYYLTREQHFGQVASELNSAIDWEVLQALSITDRKMAVDYNAMQAQVNKLKVYVDKYERDLAKMHSKESMGIPRRLQQDMSNTIMEMNYEMKTLQDMIDGLQHFINTKMHEIQLAEQSGNSVQEVYANTVLLQQGVNLTQSRLAMFKDSIGKFARELGGSLESLYSPQLEPMFEFQDRMDVEPFEEVAEHPQMGKGAQMFDKVFN